MSKIANAQLFDACCNGDTAAVTKALSLGARIDAFNQDGLCALHIASTAGYCSVVNQLVAAGASINKGREEDGQTALHRVCDEGSGMEIASFLLTAGADPNACDFSGWTPLHIAANMGDLAMVQLLLHHSSSKVDCDNTNDSNQTPLLLAAESCGTSWVGRDYDYGGVISALLGAGANVNMRDSCGDVALILAAKARQSCIVKICCEAGADVNMKTGPGCCTALHISAAQGDVATMEELIFHGCNVEAVDIESGYTALHIAAQAGHNTVACALLAAGVDPSKCCLNGLTAMHVAAQGGHTDVLQTLLTAKNAKQQHGIANECKDDLTPLDPCKRPSQNLPSPLHMACHGGHMEAVKILLDHGEDCTALDNNKESPLQTANRQGHHDVAKLLLESALGKQAERMENEDQ